MPDADLRRRVEMLENTVESLRQLPADVARLSRRMRRAESQILQLRTELRGEFSAIRRDMVTKADLADGLAAVRAEMPTKADLSALRVEFNDGIAGAVRELTGAIAETRNDLVRLIEEQIAGAQRQTKMLFEEVIGRLKIVGEGNPPPSG
jgi:chromosome segregation ATPase